MERSYLAIDLKSFYASVECRLRGMDPLTTHLVVADESRTEKTICLAVSPALKAYGIPGRTRLFEALQRVKEVNNLRRSQAPGKCFTGKSADAQELAADPGLEVDFLIAPPQMALYMQISTRIYQVYLKYVAPEDIHVYSIDEVFIDVTPYLSTYGLTPRELAVRMIQDVLQTTGITATAGIGSNLYLAKIAMDIEAKHIPADQDGVRIAELDELSYRQKLWAHRPLTDFWRVGRGYARKLEAHGLFTMGDIARCSLNNENLLYKMFGINAELLIDHAWGWEPCTIADIKSYRPQSNSISSGQVLQCPYAIPKARLIVHEMLDLLALELVEKRLVTDQLVLDIGYDVESLSDPALRKDYRGEVTADRYGRQVPKPAHGTIHLKRPGSSTRKIIDAGLALFDRITDPRLLVRRVTVTACRILPEDDCPAPPEQLDLFTDYDQQERERLALEKERSRQETILKLRKKFGKNAVLKGMNFEEGATTRARNGQIGGHKA